VEGLAFFARCGVFARTVCVIREAREWLRSEMNWDLAGWLIPRAGLEKISGNRSGAGVGGISVCGSLLETSAWYCGALIS